MLALRSCASALIVQQLTEAEGCAWALILSFRFISKIVGFSSGVLSSELLGLSSGVPFQMSEISVVALGFSPLQSWALL